MSYLRVQAEHLEFESLETFPTLTYRLKWRNMYSTALNDLEKGANVYKAR